MGSLYQKNSDTNVTSAGETLPEVYDGIGRIGMREIQKGLFLIPNSTLSKKVDRYAENRGYEAHSVKKATRNNTIHSYTASSAKGHELQKSSKQTKTPSFAPKHTYDSIPAVPQNLSAQSSYTTLSVHNRNAGQELRPKKYLPK